MTLFTFVTLLAAVTLGAAIAAAETPVVSIEPASEVEYTTATLKAAVDAKDHETSYYFDYVPQGVFERSGFGAYRGGYGSLAAGESGEPTLHLTGLSPDTTYHTRIFAENNEGEQVEAVAPTFTTKPVAKPTLSGLVASETRFSGLVDPGSPKSAAQLEGGDPEEEAIKAAFATHWWFTCLPVECKFSGPSGGTLEADDAAKEVAATPIELQPDRIYTIVLHATNAGGESTETLAEVFTTPSAPAGPTCPNEAIRVEQGATQLGDCRAFERVSPADKGGGDIIAEGESIQAAADGNAAVFDSRYGFADSVGTGNVGRTTYLARRGGGGWSTHAITPQPRPEAHQIIGPATHTEVFSPDLSRALAIGYDLPGAIGSAPERMNLYLEDTATRGLTTISSSQRGDGKDPIRYWPNEFINGVEIPGASEDLRHVTLESWTQFLPTGTAPGYPQGEEFFPALFPYSFTFNNVYTWDEGTLHLASILPDGSAAPEGARLEPGGTNGGTMSAAGSRQMFLAAPEQGAPQQLYLRIDHSFTDLVSESENPTFSGRAQNVGYEGMTPDGRNVFFSTESPLLEGDKNTGPDLYRWTGGPDPAQEDNLTLITDDGGAFKSQGAGGALVGMSADASRVYVHDSDGFLELWEEGHGLRAIDSSVERAISSQEHLTLLSAQPGSGRVSQDGDWLAYIGGATATHIQDGGAGELRLYDRRRDDVTTVARRASLVPTLTNGGALFDVGFRPRFLSNGGKVFFTSPESLLRQDTNGVADVYQYDGQTGRLSLVTSGKGSQPMEFVDASRSGDDVFFLTRSQLVSSDHDEFADLYDARVGGGFAEPESVVSGFCGGESCQGIQAQGPAAGNPASAAIRGLGNLKSRRCHAPKHRITRHGKTRCAKKQRNHRGRRSRHHRAMQGGRK